MRKLLFCLCILLCQYSAFSQKEWRNWYYNGTNMLTFKNGYPENITNFITNPPPVPPYDNLLHFYYWGQNGISYSDPASGAMKFIISNRLGFSSNYSNFPNTQTIRSCPPDQESYRIIPFENNPDKFYVIQFQSAVADLLAQETGLQVRCPNAIGLAYSIVDLSLNAGMGDVTSVNNIITTGLTEQISTVKHANGHDVWIIVHPYNSAQYKSYLVTSTGIQSPVTTTIGGMINGGSSTAGGTLCASHDGKLLAGCRSLDALSGNEGDIELFDFNNSTGILSNYRTLPSLGHVVKLSFSPDNSKLYSAGFDGPFSAGIINQWDFNQSNIAASRTTVFNMRQVSLWNMQLAPDGKIYLSGYSEYVNNVFHSYLPIIQCPNQPKYACNFKLRGFEVPNAASFPALINDFINEAPTTQAPVFSIGNDTTVCFGTLTLTAPPGWQSYRWNTGANTQSISVTQAGTYYVLTGNTGFSCPEAYGYIKVSDAAIKLNLGKDTALCQGAPYVMHIPNQYSNIVWNNGSTGRDSIITGNGGTIIINANDANGCHTSDTIVVSRKQYPGAAFGPDTILCNNETLLLRLDPPKSVFYNAVYLWQNSSLLDTFRVRQPGTYYGTVTYQGCTVSDTINVQYVNGQTFTLGADTSLCAGDTLVLTAPLANATYLWSTGATTQSIKVFNTGQYHVKVTNGLCTTKDTIQVTFQTRPVFSLGNDTTLCEGKNLLLQPNLSGSSFLWQNGSQQAVFNVTTAGLYHLKYTLNACTVSDTINIAYKNRPPVNLGNDSSLCLGEQLTLSANHPLIQSYLWQDLSTQPMLTVTTAGTYAVAVTGLNGCINTDTIKVKFVPLPIFSLGNDTAICADKTISLYVNLSPANFLWNTGSTSSSIIADRPGMYWVRVNQQGCNASDSIVVSFKSVPVLQFGADTILCEGTTLALNAGNTGAAYLWQDGSTSDHYTVNKPGLFYVMVKNANGCTAADSITIKYLSLPVVTIGRDTLLCPGQGFSLNTIVNTAVQYKWQDGSTLPSFNVGDTGTFTVTVNNVCGAASSSVVVKKGICQLYIPNAFTPNRDNINDIFRIKYPFSVRNFQMSVYNRYGQKIFASADIRHGWDGNYKGLPQENAVYMWTVSFTDIDGQNKQLQGSVLLMR